jgi:ABC-type multidrug transport system ATPase subunit
VLVDGQSLKKDVAAFRGRLGYVPQDDIIHRELRVEQVFQFAAQLRLGSEYSREEITRRVEKTARELGLFECRFRRVRSLSGGQRKRVNVGVELLAEPDILVLDEPASGLDPATEEDLLHILRRLADEERTIVLTTHSMEYLSLVDRIVVLMDGSVIFAGTMNELLAHFDIPHVADVFKTIRGQDAHHWKNKYRASPLAARAATVSKSSTGPTTGPHASTSIAAQSHDLPWL